MLGRSCASLISSNKCVVANGVGVVLVALALDSNGIQTLGMLHNFLSLLGFHGHRTDMLIRLVFFETSIVGDERDTRKDLRALGIRHLKHLSFRNCTSIYLLLVHIKIEGRQKGSLDLASVEVAGTWREEGFEHDVSLILKIQMKRKQRMKMRERNDEEGKYAQGERVALMDPFFEQ